MGTAAHVERKKTFSKFTIVFFWYVRKLQSKLVELEPRVAFSEEKVPFYVLRLPSSLINQIPLTKADLNDKSPNSVHNSIIIKLIRCDMRYIDTIFFVPLLLFVLPRPISFKLLKNFLLFLLYLDNFLSKAQKKRRKNPMKIIFCCTLSSFSLSSRHFTNRNRQVY